MADYRYNAVACFFWLLPISENVKSKSSQYSVAPSLLVTVPQVESKLSRSFRNVFPALSNSDTQTSIMRLVVPTLECS